MDDISRKLKAFDWKGLQKQAKKVQASTASALKDLVMTDLENKVRAATGDTNWGASGADLAEIAQGTYNREDFTLLMSILWQRLASTRWRCVYKALDVLKYLVMHGSSRVLEETRDALPHIRRLEHYSFVDPVTRRDEGANVRARAAAFVAMLSDDRVLEEERTKSAALRAKIGIAVPSSHYTSSAGAGGGMSSDDYRFGAASYASGGGGGGGGAQYDPPTGAGAYDPPVGVGAGGYDAHPPSQFGGFGEAPAPAAVPQLTAPTGTVDDLLGGDVLPALPAPTPNATPGLADLLAGPDLNVNVNGNGAQPSLGADDDDDDDDDFDPRAFSSAPAPAASVPTSRLVANLAAAAVQEKARNGTGNEGVVTALDAMRNNANEAAAHNTVDSAYGGLVNFGNIMQDKSTRVESKPLAGKQQQTTISPTKNKVEVEPATGIEKDPFGDLLSTAKKTGVL